jgi:hypothetical protein
VAAAQAAPELGKSVNAAPVSGTVLVSVPAGSAKAQASSLKGRKFVPLTAARQVPVGSFFDTRKGTVALTSATGKGSATQSGQFLGGIFQTLQARSGKNRGLTDLKLDGGRFGACAAKRVGKKTAQAARKRRLSSRAVRRLRGNAHGRFRTRGRYSAATVRGTDWAVTDRCDGTLTRVKRGRVVVRDFRRRKNVTLKAGKSYLARPR